MLIDNHYNGNKLKSYHFSIGEMSRDSQDAYILNMLDLFGFDTTSPTSEEAADMVENWRESLLNDKENYYFIELEEDQEDYSYSVLQIPVPFLLEFIGNTMSNKLTHIEQAVSMAANLEEESEFKRDLALSSKYISEIKKVVGDIFQQ